MMMKTLCEEISLDRFRVIASTRRTLGFRLPPNRCGAHRLSQNRGPRLQHADPAHPRRQTNRPARKDDSFLLCSGAVLTCASTTHSPFFSHPQLQLFNAPQMRRNGACGMYRTPDGPQCPRQYPHHLNQAFHHPPCRPVRSTPTTRQTRQLMPGRCRQFPAKLCRCPGAWAALVLLQRICFRHPIFSCADVTVRTVIPRR